MKCAYEVMFGSVFNSWRCFSFIKKMVCCFSFFLSFLIEVEGARSAVYGNKVREGGRAPVSPFILASVGGGWGIQNSEGL